MKDLTPKVDDTVGATGQLNAAEFNDMREDAQNAVTGTGQTLTPAVGDDNEQLLKAIAVGGRRKARSDTETADIGDIVLPNNASAALTINLPSADLFVNAKVFFEQVIDQPYSVNALTIGRSGNDIMGLTEDLDVDSFTSNNTIIMMTWLGGGTGWLVSVVGQVGSTL